MEYDKNAFQPASLGLAARPNEGGAAESQDVDSVTSGEGCPAMGGRCASTADLGGAAAYRLDKRTYFDQLTQGKQCVYLRDYGDGIAEIGWSFVSAIKPKKAGKGQSAQSQANQIRAARRARTRLRQLILGANLDHLLTLTYRENQTDFTQSSADLAKFVRKVRKALPDWLYVAVPEKQKRGAWHWHLAVKGRQDVDLLRSCWLTVVGDGNIDVQPPKRGAQRKRLAIVRYLSKYLSKTFKEDDRELNGHRFRASQGIYVPCMPIYVPPEARANLRRFSIDLLLKHARSVGHVWQDDQMIAGWACSWS